MNVSHVTISSPFLALPGAKLEPGTWLQVMRPLKEDDYERLGEFLAGQPLVTINLWPGSVTDLDFLRHIRRLYGLRVGGDHVRSIEGLKYLSDQLTELTISSKMALSLEPLQRFNRLKILGLRCDRKSLAPLSHLSSLQRLGLSGVKLRDLTALNGLDNLKMLTIGFGRVEDFAALSKLPALERLEICYMRGISTLHGLDRLAQLRTLDLSQMKCITSLPSFAPMRELRSVCLLTMKGIRDLTPISHAPSLEEMSIFQMQHLAAEDFRPFVGHPTLREINLALLSQRKEQAVRELLNLPSRRMKDGAG